jgi:hypothetical protein
MTKDGRLRRLNSGKLDSCCSLATNYFHKFPQQSEWSKGMPNVRKSLLFNLLVKGSLGEGGGEGEINPFPTISRILRALEFPMNPSLGCIGISIPIPKSPQHFL